MMGVVARLDILVCVLGENDHGLAGRVTVADIGDGGSSGATRRYRTTRLG